MLPLLAGELLGSYIFFLDFLGAIVIPLWTITLVDYFLVKRGRYSDDLFRTEGGLYWYQDGVHWPAIACLALGTAIYWLIAFALPQLRVTITATIPTVLIAGGVYALWARRAVRPHPPLIVA
jgi:nucleobase:cation symporter-1, NCS1 family